MLTELRVRDLAVIADVSLALGPGLNVLTGETGAGKSMLVDALALLLGERASSESVRPGAARAVVEGAFDVARVPGLRRAAEAAGLDVADGTLVVRREVSPEGRSRAWANGSPTTAGVLAQLGAALVDLHGQHETQSLLHADAQRDILDAWAGAAVERTAVRDCHERWRALAEREATLQARQEEVRRKADYLRHVVQEVERAAPRVGEDEALDVEAARLGNAEELGRLARELEQAVGGTGLGRAAKLLAALERLDASTGRWRELLDAAFANAEELSAAARAYAESIAADPARLAAVEKRRDELYRLRQKYGPGIPDVLAARDAAARELDLLDTADLDLRGLAEARAAAEAEFRRACATLSAARERGAASLAKAVNEILPALGLAGGRLDVALAALPTPGAHGAEAVTFAVRLNPGLPAGPLARVASGGELARVMLALKVVLAAHDAVPTLVFDEVDQGIGGEVGTRVGEALARVAGGGRQVLVITHLPQIAAFADRQLVIAKAARGGVATSDVALVEGAARERELARMLGDPDLETALRHAAELVRTARARSGTPAGTSSPPAPTRPRR